MSSWIKAFFFMLLGAVSFYIFDKIYLQGFGFNNSPLYSAEVKQDSNSAAKLSRPKSDTLILNSHLKTAPNESGQTPIGQNNLQPVIKGEKVEDKSATLPAMLIERLVLADGLLSKESDQLLSIDDFQSLVFSLQKETPRAYDMQEYFERIYGDTEKLAEFGMQKTSLNCNDVFCLVTLDIENIEQIDNFISDRFESNDPIPPFSANMAIKDRGAYKELRIIMNYISPSIIVEHD